MQPETGHAHGSPARLVPATPNDAANEKKAPKRLFPYDRIKPDYGVLRLAWSFASSFASP